MVFVRDFSSLEVEMLMLAVFTLPKIDDEHPDTCSHDSIPCQDGASGYFPSSSTIAGGPSNHPST
jgi:hypothetical protein